MQEQPQQQQEPIRSLLSFQTLIKKSLRKKYEPIDPTGKFAQHVLIMEDGTCRLEEALYFDREVFPKLLLRVAGRSDNAYIFLGGALKELNDIFHRSLNDKAPLPFEHIRILLDYALNGAIYALQTFHISVSDICKKEDITLGIARRTNPNKAHKNPIIVIIEAGCDALFAALITVYPEKLLNYYSDSYTPLHALCLYSLSSYDESFLDSFATIRDKCFAWLQATTDSTKTYGDGVFSPSLPQGFSLTPLAILVLNSTTTQNSERAIKFLHWIKEKVSASFIDNGGCLLDNSYRVNNGDTTLLHLAVQNQDATLVSVLLAHSPSLKKINNVTARDYAVRNKDTVCIKLIDQYREKKIALYEEKEQQQKKRQEEKKAAQQVQQQLGQQLLAQQQQAQQREQQQEEEQRLAQHQEEQVNHHLPIQEVKDHNSNCCTIL
jgi:hypothetical protein